MIDLLLDPTIWLSLFSVTLIQIALGADNLIIVTIIANKLPAPQRKKAITLGLVLAMLFRILFRSIAGCLDSQKIRGIGPHGSPLATSASLPGLVRAGAHTRGTFAGPWATLGGKTKH